MRKKLKREGKFYVYIVQCVDGTYYTGSTNNLETRIRIHNNGHGAKYLQGKLPVKLVYAEEYKYFKNALHAERSLKGFRRAQKEELIGIYEKSRN